MGVIDSRAPRSADPVSDADRPLRALWRRYTVYRARLILAFTFSVINKVADVMPELLIGAAVALIGGVLIAVGLGVFVLFLLALWLILRGAGGVLQLKSGRPIANPGTLLL